MSGWADPASLRKVAAGGPQLVAQPVQQAAAPVPVNTGQVAQAGPPPVCGGQAMCTEVRDFAVAITDFRPSTQGALRIVDATLRFVNKTAGPLAVGYVNGSGGLIDDQGNRYIINNNNTIRGIGVINGETADPKLVLQQGENRDTQFQFVFGHRQEILGTAFELGLTVREMNLVGAGQYRSGAEFPLHFLGLGQTSISAAPAGQPGVAAPAVQTAGVPGEQTGGAFAPQAPGAVTATPAPVSRGRSVLAGLAQSAGIPGLQQAAQPAGTAAPGQTPAAGGAAAVVPGFASQAAGLIPAFGGGSGAASGVASTAAGLIPGFSGTPSATPATLVNPAVNPAAVNPAMPVAGDPCAGQAACFNAGPFAATVARIAGVNGANGYTVRAEILFHNVSAQAIDLGYVTGSAAASDNPGGRYSALMNGTTDQSVTGMGAVGSAMAGRFVLNPGQSRGVGVTLVRPAAIKTAAGGAFNLTLQVAELSTASGQVAVVRQHPISIANVACQACAAIPAVKTAAAPAAAAATNPAASLLNGLKKK
jgi:hypothetical protein